uniref:Uncharacterized protein n=1 Tax=Ditylenchus dipsaci TaxID=166011 RepID=A0A915CXZ3_9BILA
MDKDEEMNDKPEEVGSEDGEIIGDDDTHDETIPSSNTSLQQTQSISPPSQQPQEQTPNVVDQLRARVKKLQSRLSNNHQDHQLRTAELECKIIVLEGIANQSNEAIQENRHLSHTIAQLQNVLLSNNQLLQDAQTQLTQKLEAKDQEMKQRDKHTQELYYAEQTKVRNLEAELFVSKNQLAELQNEKMAHPNICKKKSTGSGKTWPMRHKKGNLNERKHQEAITAYQTTISQLQLTAENADKEVDHWKAEHANCAKESENLKSECAKFKKEIETLKAEHATCKVEIDELRRKCEPVSRSQNTFTGYDELANKLNRSLIETDMLKCSLKEICSVYKEKCLLLNKENSAETIWKTEYKNLEAAFKQNLVKLQAETLQSRYKDTQMAELREKLENLNTATTAPIVNGPVKKAAVVPQNHPQPVQAPPTNAVRARTPVARRRAPMTVVRPAASKPNQSVAYNGIGPSPCSLNQTSTANAAPNKSMWSNPISQAGRPFVLLAPRPGCGRQTPLRNINQIGAPSSQPTGNIYTPIAPARAVQQAAPAAGHAPSGSVVQTARITLASALGFVPPLAPPVTIPNQQTRSQPVERKRKSSDDEEIVCVKVVASKPRRATSTVRTYSDAPFCGTPLSGVAGTSAPLIRRATMQQQHQQ